jgi:hypothetical protein
MEAVRIAQIPEWRLREWIETTEYLSSLLIDERKEMHRGESELIGKRQEELGLNPVLILGNFKRAIEDAIENGIL